MELNLDQGVTVVIPVYNESEFIYETIAKAHESFRLSGLPFEILVSDDGSTDSSLQTAQSSATLGNIEVIANIHQGRIGTRLGAVKKASFENVLMVDSRVQLKPESIANLKDLCIDNPQADFWNGDVEIANLALPHVSVWQTLVGIGWGSYTLNPRLCHFGIEDFDRYPKGTGLFLASKSNWIEQLSEAQELQLDSATPLSDDTRILREFASKSDIWLSPRFKALYIPRSSLSLFVKNLFYRGTTFIDSYWTSKSIIGTFVRLVLPFAFVATILSLVWVPLNFFLISVAAVFMLASVALGAVSFRMWSSFSRAVKEALVGIILWPVFSLGIIRGYFGKLAIRVRG
jgi:glycosyltransferase involved in cell wall biosynthesis